MSKLIWLHEEMLRMQHSIFDDLDHDSHVFYIWDNEHIKEACLNPRRLVFIYETLCDLPVTIYKGNTKDVINYISYKFGLIEVHTPSANSTSLRRLFTNLQYIVHLKVIDDITLFNYDTSNEYTRFFQFWNAIKKTEQLKDLLKADLPAADNTVRHIQPRITDRTNNSVRQP